MRRILPAIENLDTREEGLIFLSQNYGKLSIILPRMIHLDTAPMNYFALACKKVDLDPKNLTPSDYVIYGLKTESESDF
jgi:hypothetical protein